MSGELRLQSNEDRCALLRMVSAVEHREIREAQFPWQR